MKRIIHLPLLCIILLISFPVQAQNKKQKLWKISAAVLGAVTIADVQSSLGRPEANPFLSSGNGRFGGQGIALKSAIVGVGLGVQWLLLKKNPSAAKYAAVTNFAVAAATGTVVVRNHMLK
jgi:hypothetical protein